MQKTIALVLLALLPIAAQAVEADPVQLANDAGFHGCDTLIRSQNVGAMSSDNRRVTTDFFKETVNDSITIHTMFGSPGDSLTTTQQYRRLGNTCYVSLQMRLEFAGINCDQMFADPNNKFIPEAKMADITVAKNAGGVNMFAKTIGGICSVIYNRGDVMPVDPGYKPAPVKKASK